MKTYGSLATAPKTKSGKRRVTRKVIRRKGLPVREKLLYLGTILVFVLISSFVLSRHVELLEIHYNIQKMEQQIAELEGENSSLESQVRKLSEPDRIREQAERLGMSYDGNRVKVKSKTGETNEP